MIINNLIFVTIIKTPLCSAHGVHDDDLGITGSATVSKREGSTSIIIGQCAIIGEGHLPVTVKTG